MMKRSLLAAMLAVAAFQAGGCAAVSWAVAQFAPPQKVDAQFKPPQGKRILVLPDEVSSTKGECQTVKQLLSQRVGQLLIEHEVAGSVIPYSQVIHLETITPGYDRLTIPEIGEQLKADLVLYVHVDRFELRDTTADPLWHGVFAATVKLVDVKEGRLWPQDRPDGHRIGPIEVPVHDSSQPAHEIELTADLVEKMSDRIAKLFYDHRVDAQDLQKQQQRDKQAELR